LQPIDDDDDDDVPPSIAASKPKCLGSDAALKVKMKLDLIFLEIVNKKSKFS
jgi:hypothetical protein